MDTRNNHSTDRPTVLSSQNRPPYSRATTYWPTVRVGQEMARVKWRRAAQQKTPKEKAAAPQTSMVKLRVAGQLDVTRLRSRKPPARLLIYLFNIFCCCWGERNAMPRMLDCVLTYMLYHVLKSVYKVTAMLVD